MSILSIQSHVSYGYVGNKAAVFPLQSMGFDVSSINTVQFSNHTGYGAWTGEIFSGDHVQSIIDGLEKNNLLAGYQAILSGYMGSADICHSVHKAVARIKAANPQAIYLCDPVIGNTSCFVKPEVLDFFKSNLKGDIITPNQFEAETLSGFQISDVNSLKQAVSFFHKKGIPTVTITGCVLKEYPHDLVTVASTTNETELVAVKNKKFEFKIHPNGNGDLFSALFLGRYLKTKSVKSALAFSIYYLNYVLENTLKKETRELQVISTHYEEPKHQSLPEVFNL